MERTVLNPKELQQRVTSLMRNRHFLVEVAEACDKAYNVGVGKTDTVLFTDDEKDVLFGRVVADAETYRAADTKLDQNLAGFYAMQETVFMAADIFEKDPQLVLEDLVRETPDPVVINMAKRVAHATWVTGAAFRDRNMRDNVMAFDELSISEQNKDGVQIQASAKVLINHIYEPL